MTSVKILLGALAVITAVAGVNNALAQTTYPNRLIRIVVPTVAGGSTTMIARLAADHLTKTWGQSAIVDNRPGGNTILGTEFVAKATPDGYTLLVPSITHIVLPLLTPTPYDPIRDFAPISGLASQPYVLLLHPSVPAKNVREFVALAKRRPGQVDYSISGAASGGRIAAELFSMVAGIRMQMIPYKGGAQALTDLIGGQVQASYQAPITVSHHIKSGRLRGIGITSETRASVLPDIPTMGEAGYPGSEMITWQAIFAPAGTPKDIVNKLNGEIRKVLGAADVAAKLAAQGVTANPTTPEQFTAFMKSESAKIGKVVKAAGINIKIEN